MKSWERARSLWLMATLVSSVLVLGKTLAKPPAEQPPQITYAFPQSVPLAGWQFVQGTPTGVQRSQGPGFVTSVDDQAISGKNYRYLRNGKTLDIEMRYFKDSYIDVVNILEDFTLQNRNQKVTLVRSPSGSYGLYQRSGKLHLSACIPASGQTTVTDAELQRNQTRPSVLATRAIPWFLGMSPLRDMRCLWAHLSIPSAGSDAAEVNPDSESARELAQAWAEWAQWWQKNYPPEP